MEPAPFNPGHSFVTSQLARLRLSLVKAPDLPTTQIEDLQLRMAVLHHRALWGLFDDLGEIVAAGDLFRRKVYAVAGELRRWQVTLDSWEEQTAVFSSSYQGRGYYPLVLQALLEHLQLPLVSCPQQSLRNQRAWTKAGAEQHAQLDRLLLPLEPGSPGVG